MDWSPRHPYPPAVSFDGGDLDCGNGLLLLIRRHIDPLEPGQLLEIKSTDTSVEEDLPAWCRLTRNELVSRTRAGKVRSYLVRKGSSAARRLSGPEPEAPARPAAQPSLALRAPAVEPLPPFAVMGIGSWP